MLSKIIIQNVALIQSLELDFCGRLNILSGETGAGKSIIVDSLLLLLGAKYDKTILRYGTDEGFVEGVFDSDGRIKPVLEEFGFDADETLIVRRKFFSNGKNEIRLNGRLSTALTLEKITGRLVDIYGQNEYQSLAQKSEHLKILDYFLRSELSEPAKKLRDIYAELLKINRELRETGDAQERARNLEFIRFQIEEIKKAGVAEGEEEELAERRKIISSGAKIATELSVVYAALTDSDGTCAAALIDRAAKSLETVSPLSNRFKALYERIRSVKIELNDIAETCEQELSGLEFDPGELEKIERRLETVRGLKRKYGSFSEMRDFLKKHEALLYTMENGAEIYEKLLKEKQKKLAEAYALCKTLSALRKQGAEKFGRLILAELSDLGMPGAEFYIEFGEFPDEAAFESRLAADGADRPEFYFSANKGQPAKPLVKIISGGELSRFMLALKTVSSNTDSIPTMIFDEIDTGISGKIGQEVAKKLAVISSEHQVLCVTHLPQIASMADNHYYIEKRVQDNDTVTSVRLLDKAEEIEEISRLSGAKDISQQAAENARQMKEWSNQFKLKLA